MKKVIEIIKEGDHIRVRKIMDKEWYEISPIPPEEAEKELKGKRGQIIKNHYGNGKIFRVALEDREIEKENLYEDCSLDLFKKEMEKVSLLEIKMERFLDDMGE